jgi:hypothetical protein
MLNDMKLNSKVGLDGKTTKKVDEEEICKKSMILPTRL